MTPPQDPILSRLADTYACFRELQPLAIGIHKAIIEQQPEIDKAALKRALQRYTASTRYLKAIVGGSARYGLDGTTQGEITAEQKKQAKDTLAERFRQQAERRREAEQAKERQAKLEQLAAKFKRD